MGIDMFGNIETRLNILDHLSDVADRSNELQESYVPGPNKDCTDFASVLVVIKNRCLEGKQKKLTSLLAIVKPHCPSCEANNTEACPLRALIQTEP